MVLCLGRDTDGDNIVDFFSWLTQSSMREQNLGGQLGWYRGKTEWM